MRLRKRHECFKRPVVIVVRRSPVLPIFPRAAYVAGWLDCRSYETEVQVEELSLVVSGDLAVLCRCFWMCESDSAVSGMVGQSPGITSKKLRRRRATCCDRSMYASGVSDWMYVPEVDTPTTLMRSIDHFGPPNGTSSWFGILICTSANGRSSGV